MDTRATGPNAAIDPDPTKYRHWTSRFEGEVARLTMEGPALRGANSELELKSNSYDLSVDIELADASSASASSIHP